MGSLGNRLANPHLAEIWKQIGELMPTARIEMELVIHKWVVQVEASSFMGTRRKVLNAVTAEDAFELAKRAYDELIAQVTPKAAVNVEPAAAMPIPPATEEPPRRGRHPNDCTCERCVTKRQAVHEPDRAA